MEYFLLGILISTFIILLFDIITNQYNKNKLRKKEVNLYWYELKFIYRKKENQTFVFDFTMQMGFKEHSDILNHRMIKNTVRLDKYKMIKIKSLKRYLCNGTLDMQTMCYLGHFPNPNINQLKK